MIDKDFNRIIDERLQKCKETLQLKSYEYALPNDRLANFRRASRILTDSKEMALIGMFVKHLVSILEMVDKGEYPEAMWDEKIGDTINYLLLLDACVKDKG